MPEQFVDFSLKVLLVDDNATFRNALHRMLAAEPWLEVIACVGSGEEAIQKAQELAPDLVLMDLSMPGMNGLEATLFLKSEPQAPRVVVLSLNSNDLVVDTARQFKADGFASKSEVATELLPLIQTLFGLPASLSVSDLPPASLPTISSVS